MCFPLHSIPNLLPPTPAEALLSFKANLSDPEGALAAWQPDTNPCSATAPWGGIACDADDRVVALRLDGRALGGTLGGGLEGVERLAEIRLAGNNLTGDEGRTPLLCGMRWGWADPTRRV
jgi:hypothetical protein